MKILRHAIEAADWSYQIRCWHCQTELEAVMSDVKYTGEPGDWHDSGWERYEINCPECDTSLTIPSDQIHNLIKAKIQKKCRKWF